jgi:hypothetical protein
MSSYCLLQIINDCCSLLSKFNSTLLHTRKLKHKTQSATAILATTIAVAISLLVTATTLTPSAFAHRYGSNVYIQQSVTQSNHCTGGCSSNTSSQSVIVNGKGTESSSSSSSSKDCGGGNGTGGGSGGSDLIA